MYYWEKLRWYLRAPDRVTPGGPVSYGQVFGAMLPTALAMLIAFALIYPLMGDTSTARGFSGGLLAGTAAPFLLFTFSGVRRGWWATAAGLVVLLGLPPLVHALGRGLDSGWLQHWPGSLLGYVLALVLAPAAFAMVTRPGPVTPSASSRSATPSPGSAAPPRS